MFPLILVEIGGELIFFTQKIWKTVGSDLSIYGEHVISIRGMVVSVHVHKSLCVTAKAAGCRATNTPPSQIVALATEKVAIGARGQCLKHVAAFKRPFKVLLCNGRASPGVLSGLGVNWGMGA